MRSLITAILFFIVSTVFSQVTNFELISKMDGLLKLEDGTKITTWGYGWDVPNSSITIPSPILFIKSGDSVNVRLRNLSAEAHTIHLHGLDVSQVNDGVPSTSFYVWQGDTATYSFNADYPGVFLYHCHVTTTLHLTMGMYGMVLVDHPDSVLFDGGPSYTKQYPFLTSDLLSTLSPVSPPPFNTITPDYFMVNGMAGQDLNIAANAISILPNESVALRLANIAYSTVRYILPEGVEAEVFMSDGRPLPQSFTTDTLVVYSGERYSVMLKNNSNANVDDVVRVEYYNVVSNTLKYTNEIPINMQVNSIDENRVLVPNIYPNPFKNTFTVKNVVSGKHTLYNANLQIISEFITKNEKSIIFDLTDNSKGLYFLKSPNGAIVKVIKQ